MAEKAVKKERKKPVRRTAEQKAQDALDVVQRKYDRAMARVVRLEAELSDAQREVDDARGEVDFWKHHPALAGPAPTVLADAPAE